MTQCKYILAYNALTSLVNLGVALVFFIGGQVCMFLFNTELCQLTERVTDGAPFQTLFNTIAVFFVFRFWDSITEGRSCARVAR